MEVYDIMRLFITLAIGAVIGAFCMHYSDNAVFAAKVRQQTDSAVSSAATSAHSALNK